MSNWVRVRNSTYEEIQDYCRANKITATPHNTIISPITFEPHHDWFIEDEKERLMFILKFGESR